MVLVDIVEGEFRSGVDEAETLVEEAAVATATAAAAAAAAAAPAITFQSLI